MRELVVDNYVINEPILNILYRLQATLTNGKLKDILPKSDNILVTCPHHASGMESKPAANIYIGNNEEIPYGYFRCFVCEEQGTFLKFVAECFDSSLEFAKDWLVKTFSGQVVEKQVFIVEDIKLTRKVRTKGLDKSILENYTDNYAYFHYFSDSCYLITTLDEFYQFFIENNNKTYINYYLERNFLYKNSRFTLYKGSQWMSLHSNIVHKLLDNIILFNKYKEAIRNRTIRLITGAPDELIITHIIVNDICKRKPKEYNVFNNNLRFIRWKNCRRVYCPNYLYIDNVSEEEIKSIKKNKFLAIRKIDYKNYKAIDLVNRLKGE